MDTSSLLEFPDTEADYYAWVQRFPFGYVINAWKTSGSKPSATRYIMWHRADCDHIDPDWPVRYVSGDTMKVCSTNPAALAIWAKSRSEPLTYCDGCYHRWLSEQAANPS